MRGLDTEGDDASCGGDGRGAPAGGAKFVRLADHVVGRKDQHERIAIAFRREYGGDRNRGAGVAAHGLKHDVGVEATLAQLLRYDEPEVRVGDDDWTP